MVASRPDAILVVSSAMSTLGNEIGRPSESAERAMPPGRWRQALRVVGCLLLAVMTWLAAVTGYVAWVGARDDAAPADAIIVLGAAAYDAKPSPVFEQRISHALALYRRGLAPRVVFTGGFGGPARFSESQVARRYVLKRGVPSRAILIETRSRTTRQSLAVAAALLQERRVRRVIIVSDPAHMARALWLARRQGLDAMGSPTPTSRFATRKVRLMFLVREVVAFHGELWAELVIRGRASVGRRRSSSKHVEAAQ